MEIFANEKDFVTSLTKALDDTDYQWRNYEGLIIAGSHAPTDIKEKLNKINEARHSKRPFLGICLGHQLVAIEWARNALGKWKANSTEIDPNTDFPIVIKLNDPPDYKEGVARRVGMKATVDLWGNPQVESFWENYKINNEYLEHFVQDWKFTQTYDPDLGEYIVDYLFYKPAFESNSIFLSVQFHPEYQNSPKKPHWVFREFLKVAKLWTQKHGSITGPLL